MTICLENKMPISSNRDSVEGIIDKSVNRISVLILQNITSIDDIESSFVGITWGLIYENLLSDISILFQWQRIRAGSEFAKGFPGIVLTATIGRLISPEYDPQNNFYGINPRPLFEKHIGPALRDKYRAPMGKSDPLNVAKNANVIDEVWASGRRPESAALAAVRFIDWIKDASRADLEKFVDVLIWCYLSIANLYNRQIPEIPSGRSHFQLHTIFTELISNAPAGGNTAQVIVGAVLQAQHTIFNSDGLLEGVGESVNATNTTGGKAGDFTECFDGNLRIYEVTTKTVDNQRVNESVDAIIKYLQNIDFPLSSIEVTFLCPKQSVNLDLPYSTSTHTSVFKFDGIQYTFVDLNEWLLFMLERLGISGREIAYNIVREYIGSSSTALSVKRLWENRVIYTT